MKSIVTESDLHMIFLGQSLMKLSQEFNLFSSSLKVVSVKKPLYHMNQVIEFEFLMTDQELRDALDWNIGLSCLSIVELVVIRLCTSEYLPHCAREVDDFFSKVYFVSLFIDYLLKHLLRHLRNIGIELLLLSLLLNDSFGVNSPKRQTVVNTFFQIHSIN